MGCGCAKNKAIGLTSEAILQQQQDFEARVQAEMAKSADTPPEPKPLPRVVRK